ncbi:unnamed protein product [Medioppia subpectinata]|uniref:Protein kinase domain-containing protein n=1 Tax=Medioppia subpectinata TaxID=1979941 RepID=A0A7R9L6Q0_9ACAR|nr:unnamed protein product [Medioppia subpectinata]CAG2116522.1 unnamed protein product [Medioppia subpectinata]
MSNRSAHGSPSGGPFGDIQDFEAPVDPTSFHPTLLDTNPPDIAGPLLAPQQVPYGYAPAYTRAATPQPLYSTELAAAGIFGPRHDYSTVAAELDLTQPWTAAKHHVERLGFRFDRVFGFGAFGDIWLVSVEGTVFQLACRLSSVETVIARSGQSVHEAVRQLLREVEAMRGLRHPNILSMEWVVCARATGLRALHLFVFMAVCKGDMWGLIETLPDRKQTEAQAHDWFVQSCHGLQYLHRQRVAHLDLKPENILYLTMADTRTGQPKRVYKLTDYGLAQWFPVNEPDMQNPVRKNSIVYMSDELVSAAGQMRGQLLGQLLGQTRFDTRKVDVYAMGVTLAYAVVGAEIAWECLQAGKLPSGAVWIPEHMYDKAYSQQLIALMRSMTCADPNTRYTVDQVLESEWVTGNEQAYGAPPDIAEPAVKVISTGQSATDATKAHPLIRLSAAFQKARAGDQSTVTDRSQVVGEVDVGAGRAGPPSPAAGGLFGELVGKRVESQQEREDREDREQQTMARLGLPFSRELGRDVYSAVYEGTYTEAIANIQGRAAKFMTEGDRPVQPGHKFAAKRVVFTADTDVSRRLRYEIEKQVLKELVGHPNVVTYRVTVNFGRQTVLSNTIGARDVLCYDRSYIVIDYTDAVHLGQFKGSGGLTDGLAVQFIQGLSAGLFHMHNNGIIKGDINDEGVLICTGEGPDGYAAKWADFGASIHRQLFSQWGIAISDQEFDKYRRQDCQQASGLFDSMLATVAIGADAEGMSGAVQEMRTYVAEMRVSHQPLNVLIRKYRFKW